MPHGLATSNVVYRCKYRCNLICSRYIVRVLDRSGGQLTGRSAWER